MKKYLLYAVLWLVGIAPACAEPTRWSFSYQGFVDAATGVFDPKIVLKGEFVGQDRNADGVLLLDELSYFESEGHRFLPQAPDPGGAGCGSFYLACSVYHFSYAQTGQLDYAVGTSGADEFYYHWWFSDTVIGSHFGYGAGNTLNGEMWEVRYNWSDKTAFHIAATPVPEPTAAFMLPAGLALIYLMRVRRRRLSIETGARPIPPSRTLRAH